VGGIDNAHAALSHTVEDQIPADGCAPLEDAGAVSARLRQSVPPEDERLRAGIYREIPVCRTIGRFCHRITSDIHLGYSPRIFTSDIHLGQYRIEDSLMYMSRRAQAFHRRPGILGTTSFYERG
jgi:hypothetical protein